MKLKKTSQKGAGISGDLGRSAIIAGDQTSRHKMPAPIRRQNQDKGQRKVQLAKAVILCMMALSTTTFAHGEEKSAESEKIEELLEKVIMLEEKLVGAQIDSLENNNADYLLEKIISVEESLANMQKDSMFSWNAGDIIISSATILSFLGFGSFLQFMHKINSSKKCYLAIKYFLHL